MAAASTQGLLEEREDLLPAVHGLLLPVRRAVVAMELVVLAVLLQLGLVLVDLFRRRRLVLVAEDPEDRAREILGEVDGRRWLVRGQLFLRHDHAAAPALDHRVEALQLAAREERLAASRARAEDADFPVHVRLRAEP